MSLPRFRTTIDRVTGLQRLAEDPTFIDKNYIPEFLITRPHWIEKELESLKKQYSLFYNLELCRYVLYALVTRHDEGSLEDLRGKLVQIAVIEGPNGEYREPGHWFIIRRRIADQSQGGTITSREYNSKVADRLNSPSEGEVTFARRWINLMYELQKDIETYLVKKRVTVKPTGPKTVTFLNAKTGQKTTRNLKKGKHHVSRS